MMTKRASRFQVAWVLAWIALSGAAWGKQTLDLESRGLGWIEVTPEKTAYAIGEEVILTAVPGQSYIFQGWGDEDGRNPRVVTIDETNRYVARFLPQDSTEWQLVERSQQVFGTPNPDQIHDMARNEQGNLLLAVRAGGESGGNKSPPHFGPSDYWLVHADRDGEILWQKSFGGDRGDFVQSVIELTDGGILLGGSTQSDVSGNKETSLIDTPDIWLVKTDRTGEKEWERTFGGSGPDRVRDMVPTPDGGALIVGWTSGASPTGNRTAQGFGQSDYWAVRLDADGNRIWEKAYGGRGPDRCQAVVPVGDDGFLLAGWSSSGIDGSKGSPRRGHEDYWVVRIDADGTPLWDQTYGGVEEDQIRAAVRTRDGGFLLGGSSRSFPSGNRTAPLIGGDDYWIVKIDTHGRRLWDRAYGGRRSDELEALAATADGGAVVAGVSASVAGEAKQAPRFSQQGDFWLFRIDSGGHRVWETSFGGRGRDVPYALDVDGEDIVVAGEGGSDTGGNKRLEGFGESDGWLVRFGAALRPSGAPRIDVNGKPVIQNEIQHPDAVSVELDSDFPEARIFYTLDGSAPTPASRRYSGPFRLTEPATLRARAYRGDFSGFAEAEPVEIFIGEMFLLERSVAGEGRVRADPDRPRYPDGARVQVEAVPAPGWEFKEWAGDATGKHAAVDLVMTEDRSVEARFERVRKLSVETTRGGRVDVEPDLERYFDGDEVTLTVEADPGFRFLGWEGDIAESRTTDNPLELTLDRDRSLLARFGLTQITVEILGEGEVERSPDRPGYEPGESVTLTAVGEDFLGWGDGVADRTRTVTVEPDRFLQARFGEVEPMEGLAVRVGGELIEDGAAAAVEETTVELEGEPLEDGMAFYTLDGSEPTVQARPYDGAFRVGRNATLRARAYSEDFRRGAEAGPVEIRVDPGFTLNAEVRGEGRVTADPEEEFYRPGAEIQLTARPAAGWGFRGWTGDAAEPVNPLSMTVTGDVSVTAHFAEFLPLTTESTDGGSIERHANQPEYLRGREVRLEALPDPDFVFVGWTGDPHIDKLGNPLRFRLTEAATLKAHFAPRPEDEAIEVASRPASPLWFPDGPVRDTVVRDGRVYVAGEFEYWAPHPGGGATVVDRARGETDPAWPVVEGDVRAVESDGEGGWFIGGDFDAVGGKPLRNLAHIDGNGNPDMDFRPDPNGPVIDLRTSEPNDLYVGGAFTQVGDRDRRFLAVLRQDTGRVLPWAPEPDGFVFAIEPTADLVYVGGQFDRIGEQRRPNAAAIDRADGLATAWAPSPDGAVEDLIAADETIYLAGLFRRVRNEERLFLAEVDAQEGHPTAWAPRPDRPVQALELGDDRIYAAGAFREIGGRERTGLAAVARSDDSVLDWRVDLGGAVRLRDIELRDGRLYFAGGFDSLEGSLHANAAAVAADTGEGTDWAPEIAGFVGALGVGETSVFIGGRDLSPNAVRRPGLAALSTETGELLDWDPAVEGAVSAMAVHDETLYFGGAFERVQSRSRVSLAAVDLETGDLTDWDPNRFNEAMEIDAIQGFGSKIYLAGKFDRVIEKETQNLAAVDPETGEPIPPFWSSDGRVRDLTVAGPFVVLGGEFTRLNGESRSHLAAIAGETGVLTDWSPEADGTVDALSSLGNEVFVGGDFSHIGESERRFAAAVDTRTGLPTEWSPRVDGPVNALAGGGGTIFVGGELRHMGGDERSGLSAIDRTTGRILDWSPQPEAPHPRPGITSLTLGEGALWVGGRFRRLAGRFHPYLASFERDVTREGAALAIEGARSQGGVEIEVHGDTGEAYVLEVSSDLLTWSAVKTDEVPFTHRIPNAASHKAQFFRARRVER